MLRPLGRLQARPMHPVQRGHLALGQLERLDQLMPPDRALGRQRQTPLRQIKRKMINFKLNPKIQTVKTEINLQKLLRIIK